MAVTLLRPFGGNLTGTIVYYDAPTEASLIAQGIASFTSANYIGSTGDAGPAVTTKWAYASAPSGIVNSVVAVTVIAAAGAGLRNYISAIQISTDTLGAATELALRDGAAGAVLFRLKLGTAALVATNFYLATPIRSSANTLLEVVTLTASVTGGVFVNAQGYQAA